MKYLMAFLMLWLCFFPVHDTAAAFHFAVLSDRCGGPNQQAYEQVVADIARLCPDFVITVGDLADDCRNEAGWRKAMEPLRQLSCPVYYTPGNWDIQDTQSAEVFRRVTGNAPYYSFDYQGCHFTVVNNAVIECYAQMEDEQKAWLAADLQKNRDKDQLFVFMHKPFWAQGIAQGKPDALHELFVKYDVDAVFTGHWHQNGYAEIDGIEYNLAGSSGGAYPGDENTAMGCFYQFLWCAVDERGLHTSIVKSGALYDKDLVSIDQEQLCYKIHTELISARAALRKPVDDTRAHTITVEIRNETDAPIQQPIAFSCPENWRIEPLSLPVAIEAGATLRKQFSAHILDQRIYPLPILQFTYPVCPGKAVAFSKNIHLVRSLDVPEASAPIVVDGHFTLQEWQNAEKVDQYGSLDGRPADIAETVCYFCRDASYLYIGVFCLDVDTQHIQAAVAERDGPVYRDDCLGFMWAKGEHLYQLFINPLATIFDRAIDAKRQQSDTNWNSAAVVATGRHFPYWHIELAIPLAELGLSEDAGVPFNFFRRQTKSNAMGYFVPYWGRDVTQWGTLRHIPAPAR